MNNNKIRWGYAGVFPGDLNIWKGDPLLNKLNFMVDHGFQSLHLSITELTGPRASEIADFTQKHDLDVVTGPYISPADSDRDAVKRKVHEFLDLLPTLKQRFRMPILATGAGGVHRFMRSPNLSELLDLLTESYSWIAPECEKQGIPLSIENHGDFYCSDLVELCTRVPSLKIFLDTGNCFLIGEEPVSSCRLAAPYTIGAHIKDHYVHPDPRELKFVLEGAPLGAGDVGLLAIYEDLISLAPNPSALVMQWEMVPPKDMISFDCLEQSWRFIRSLPSPA